LAAELRWILLGLGLLLLAAIWWWTARRSGQAPGDAALRESTIGKPLEPTPLLDPSYADSDDDRGAVSGPRDWGVPPFEPLNIRTADFERVPVLDGPMMIDAAPGLSGSPAFEPAPASRAEFASPPTLATASPSTLATASQPALGTAQPSALATASPSTLGTASPSAPAPNATEQQRIVTIRVCAVGETRWSGAQLMAALELHGLAFGRYQVFHRKHVDGRSLFCVASLVEPGTFDVAAMADQDFRGVTLFAVLPGPLEPLETMDELFGTARGLAEELSGMVQDGKGMPLSPQRAAALREDVARFQATLPRN
jgi:cell division protein ZipA